MVETEAKYHHLIPQTYMSAWANSSGTLKVEFINQPGKIVDRNKEKIAGINDFHSIRAGMPLCTALDTATIFSPVSGYTIEYEGKELTTTLELNKYYYDFDKWFIKRSDGTPVSKKRIRSEIDQIKIKDIEANWSVKYENNWNQEVTKIEAAVLNTANGSIHSFDRDFLMRFYTALDWRGFRSNQLFEDAYQKLTCGILNDVEIPLHERILPSLKTAADEIRHELLLQFYRKYLNDDGVIYIEAMESLAHTNFHFLVADGSKRFITCDSPAFTHKMKDGQLVGLLPITPRILMAKGKCSDNGNYFSITHITDNVVILYNDIIRKSAKEFVIHPL